MRLNSDKEELEKKCKRTQIGLSRYGVLSLDSSFIHEKKFVAFSALARFGFAVVVLGYDGASEIRNTVKLLCDMSVTYFLSENN